TIRYLRAALLSTSLLAVLAVTLRAQSKPVIHELTKPDAASTARFGNVIGVRALPNGSVLVNDGGRRQVLLLDATLHTSAIQIDSSGAGVQTYGRTATMLVPYLGDSSVFVDDDAISLVVIDPNGKIVRAMAPPDAKAMQFLWRYPSGFDPQGRYIFRSQFAEKYVPTKNTPAGILPVFPDSAPILRANLDTRTTDTILSVKVRRNMTIVPSIGSDGTASLDQLQEVITTVDDYAILSDGSIAIVRGQDYHVDVLRPDGTKFSGAKLPFDFKRMTDDDKQKMIDSARAAADKRRADARAANGTLNRPPTAPGVAAPQTKYVPIKDMPDYYPPIRIGSSIPDCDGNLWILPTTSAQSNNGELVYDVVDNRGAFKYRVRMPPGRSVTGCAPNGVVFLISKDARGWLLERSRIDITMK
ncbi:MAG: hypothetical protein ABJB74_21680, partial [Gemmatimonas sp.]